MDRKIKLVPVTITARSHHLIHANKNLLNHKNNCQQR